MKYRFVIVCLSSVFFSGCELFVPVSDSTTGMIVNKKGPFCVWQTAQNSADCKIESWLQYWSDTESLPWPERKQLIDSLTTSNKDVLKKVFLSQGKSTPYQNRLRAQSWLESIFPNFSAPMQEFMTVAVYQPSQDLLELESALVTLSKINSQQSSTMEEQQIRLENQQNQIEQLLNIEASIIQRTEGDKQ